MTDAINHAFTWGDTEKAIREKIESLLIPAIERHDMAAFVPKLDAVLTEIVNSTNLAENHKILENFKTLMVEPDKEMITASELFKEYCKFVAAECDTSGREVIADGGDDPYYTPIEAEYEVEENELLKWSGMEHLVLHFRVDEPDQQDALNFDVPISRWKKSRFEGYVIDYKSGVDIQSLQYMSNFECLMNRLKRAMVRVIVDRESGCDSVIPDNQPEMTFE